MQVPVHASYISILVGPRYSIHQIMLTCSVPTYICNIVDLLLYVAIGDLGIVISRYVGIRRYTSALTGK